MRDGDTVSLNEYTYCIENTLKEYALLYHSRHILPLSAPQLTHISQALVNRFTIVHIYFLSKYTSPRGTSKYTHRALQAETMKVIIH